MAEERSRSTDDTGLIRTLDDMLAHARFNAVLDQIGDLRSAGPLSPRLETAVTLARCRALLGLGRWKEAAEVAEKKLQEFYALHPEDKRSILEFHISAGRAAWRIRKARAREEHFRAAYHISRWEFEDTAGMLRTRNLLGLCFLGAGGAASRRLGALARSARGARGGALSRGGQLLAQPEHRAPQAGAAHAGRRGAGPGANAVRRARAFPAGRCRAGWSARSCSACAGEIRAAEKEVLGAVSESEEHGFERERVIALEYAGDLALDRHDNQGAIEAFDRALLIAERLAPEGDLIPELCRRIAEVHVRIGEPNRALITCERGLRIARRLDDRFEEAATHRVMAMAHHLLGHREKALRQAQEGVSLLRKLEAVFELTRLLVWLGETLLAGGDAEERRAARDHLWEARSHAMSMSLERWVERIEKVLGVELPRRLRPARRDRVRYRDARGARTPTASAFGIVTQDPRMRELVRVLERASASRLPILVLGESGRGRSC